MFHQAFVVWGTETSVNQYLAFRQFFSLKNITNLTLHIRAHSNYVLFINKKRIGFGQFQDFEHHKVYDSLTIEAKYLKKKNTIDILAYYQGENSSTYRKGQPSLIFEISQGDAVICSSGPETRFSPVTGYRNGKIEKISKQLAFTFEYDAHASIFTNKTSSYLPAVAKKKSGNYYPRPVEKLKIIPQIPSVLLKQGYFSASEHGSAAEKIYYAGLSPIADKNSSGQYYIYDLQSEKAGYLTFDITLPEDCRIDIGYGEHLDDLRVRTLIDDRHFGFCYHGKKGRNQFTYYFTRIAGRYLQLHVYSMGSCKIHYAGMDEAVYPTNKAKSCRNLDFFEQKIYDTSIQTLMLCMHEHYEDCPWREQALYAMDARFQMLCGYLAFSEYRFARASLELLALSQRKDGLLELCAPAKVPITIPSFSLVWVAALNEYVEHSSDTAFAREMIAVSEKILTSFSMKNGLVENFQGRQYWNFYEWNPLLDGLHEVYPCDCALNLFYLIALKAHLSLLEKLHMREGCLKWKEKISALTENINLNFYDTGLKCYVFSAGQWQTPELIQTLAVISGAAPSGNQISDGLRQRSYQPETPLNNKFFRYEALLSEEGNLPFILEEIKKIWGKMLFQGATSFWETEKGASDFNNAGSLCHGWSAVPAYIYLKYKK